MSAHTPFLEMLHGQGRKQAKRWSAGQAHGVGHHGSVDLAQWLD